MTLTVVKTDILDHYAGIIPEHDVDGWIGLDSQLCDIPAGVYEVVYRRATFNSESGLDISKPRYIYSNEVGIGVLTPSAPLFGSTVDSLKERFRAYNMILVPRQSGAKCMLEYSVGYQPTKLLAYYSSFIVSVRKVRVESPTYDHIVALLLASGYGGSASLRAAGIHA